MYEDFEQIIICAVVLLNKDGKEVDIFKRKVLYINDYEVVKKKVVVIIWVLNNILKETVNRKDIF